MIVACHFKSRMLSCTLRGLPQRDGRMAYLYMPEPCLSKGVMTTFNPKLCDHLLSTDTHSAINTADTSFHLRLIISLSIAAHIHYISGSSLRKLLLAQAEKSITPPRRSRSAAIVRISSSINSTLAESSKDVLILSWLTVLVCQPDHGRVSVDNCSASTTCTLPGRKRRTLIQGSL